MYNIKTILAHPDKSQLASCLRLCVTKAMPQPGLKFLHPVKNLNLSIRQSSASHLI